VAQVTEHLLCKREALNSNPRPPSTKKVNIGLPFAFQSIASDHTTKNNLTNIKLMIFLELIKVLKSRGNQLVQNIRKD
jgi:hypothetical protein